MSPPGGGWYPDPASDIGLRYWTGSHWTAETRPSPAALHPELLPPNPATRVQGRRKGMHPILAGVLGAIGGWLTIGTVLGMTFTAFRPTVEMGALGSLLGLLVGATLGAGWAFERRSKVRTAADRHLDRSRRTQ
ncbi:DUF2510 domain-containing protein [Georgenia subflava]|uniref:DUF2510 domain-containing protein n=1 Tax=Georgenia subflava TaxID=1622177 RepID=A0A6N7EF25_9MICO|nr:DUF2510 domain-containing protein [Georgenia subflava]